MNLLLTHPYRVYGLKLTKSEPIIGTAADFAGKEIWDGINKPILLGQFEQLETAIHFAENVKNNSPKKSFKITVENSELNTSEEIGYTERENYSSKKQNFYYQK